MMGRCAAGSAETRLTTPQGATKFTLDLGRDRNHD